MKNSIKNSLLVVLTMVLFASCAHVQPIQECLVNSEVRGFWWGLWNGMTAGFSFIGSLFDKDIAVYAVNNNGAWYNFGFVLGISGLFGGGSRISK